jgi:hypothetical protein
VIDRAKFMQTNGARRLDETQAEDPEAMATAMQRLLDDELTFVDMSRSSVFIAEEHLIF